MNIDEWRSQIKRGTLEFCVLLLISRAPRYGYEIISRLESRPIVAAKESTVYPLLRRLQKDGCLTSFWQETAEGLPPRCRCPRMDTRTSNSGYSLLTRSA